jgi:molybdenum cofactor synthesis domain-containing protein
MSQPESSSRVVTACLLIIGNEILSGRTDDANLAFLARGLNDVGVQLREARVIPDVPEVIIATVQTVREQFDYVLTTGGIGPTHDDITTECVARSFGLKLVLNEEAHRRLAAHYARRGAELNEARLRMAHLPEGALLIDNPLSAAPGFRVGNVFVLAGVPIVCKAMFEQVKGMLQGGASVLTRSVTCDLSEGNLAADLSAIQDAYPKVEIGSYPFWRPDMAGVSLVMRSADATALDGAAEEVLTMVKRLNATPERITVT